MKRKKGQGTSPMAITAFGITQGLKAWERDPRCVVGRATLWRRIQKGVEPERALTEPTLRHPWPPSFQEQVEALVGDYDAHETLSMWEASQLLGIKPRTLEKQTYTKLIPAAWQAAGKNYTYKGCYIRAAAALRGEEVRPFAA